MSNTYTKLAKEIIVNYFEAKASKDMISYEGLKECMNIKFDETNHILLNHCIAMRNIFEKAIQEIEESEKIKNSFVISGKLSEVIRHLQSLERGE